MIPDATDRCAELSCGCASVVPRRDFLLAAGAGALAALTTRLPAMAGPFEAKDFDKLVPADKGLDPEWVKSLSARGTPTVYHRDELKYIGMPVGGICAGQLYLGGDGRLWHWDIFNRTVPTVCSGDHYANPVVCNSTLEQGFALRVGDREWPLTAVGFADLSFCGQYPIGRVEYRDKSCPIEISLEAFSPFIPLNAADSGLPVTVMRFALKNRGARQVQATLSGRLENVIGNSQANIAGWSRYIRQVNEPNARLLEYGHRLAEAETKLDETDLGTMVLALLEPGPDDTASEPIEARAGTKMLGRLSRMVVLKAEESVTLTFLITWHFPNLVKGSHASLKGREYATRFHSATSVAKYVANNFDHFYRQTKLWCETWYEQSTLPHWFLERTLANASILATSTCFWFAGGRFYANEGVGCCDGTCTHVWLYEQAMGRLFPELDRSLREQVDFGVAFNEKTGGVGMRGEDLKSNQPTEPAVDGQAGVILRAYRAHQFSNNSKFLTRNWPRIKQTMQYLINRDLNRDGILEGAQHNTLDTTWYGSVAWLSGLYVAALRAAVEMATDVKDREFAKECRALADAGRTNIVSQLFDDGYFINKPDLEHLDAINSGSGCEIDQVLGQSWAFQTGLERVIPQKETVSALRSLWRYNFTRDVGPYRQKYPSGRWFALTGEAGLLMCTFPRSDWSFEKSAGKSQPDYASYFNECMNGFEHQVAGHMIWEEMVHEGLAVERAIHDRYHAAHRNPWNEIECGDHYSRSMASYGVFIAACGFEHHGPKEYLAFAPRLAFDDFAAAFTAAEGWGQFRQKRDGTEWKASVAVRSGLLRIKTLALAWQQIDLQSVRMTLADRQLPINVTFNNARLTIELKDSAILSSDDELRVTATQVA